MTHLLETTAASSAARFGDHLRHWRALRRHSQMSLSLEADISARHVSFMESGRAQPSRDMVLRLAGVLDMPKEAANQALNAAGFAPAFPALNADAPELKPVRRAVDMMLERHNPFPALAIDRHWDILAINASAARLFAMLPPPSGGRANLIGALIDAAKTDIMENWTEVASLTIARLRSEIATLGGDETLRKRIKTLETLLREIAPAEEPPDFGRPVIPTVFRIGDQRLTLFSTIASFSTVQDVSASDIRIELMFPEDNATQAFFENGRFANS